MMLPSERQKETNTQSAARYFLCMCPQLSPLLPLTLVSYLATLVAQTFFFFYNKNMLCQSQCELYSLFFHAFEDHYMSSDRKYTSVEECVNFKM